MLTSRFRREANKMSRFNIKLAEMNKLFWHVTCMTLSWTLFIETWLVHDHTYNTLLVCVCVHIIDIDSVCSNTPNTSESSLNAPSWRAIKYKVRLLAWVCECDLLVTLQVYTYKFCSRSEICTPITWSNLSQIICWSSCCFIMIMEYKLLCAWRIIESVLISEIKIIHSWLVGFALFCVLSWHLCTANNTENNL